MLLPWQLWVTVENRLNSEHVLTCYTWNTVLNTTVRKFNNSNICAVNAVQKKFVFCTKLVNKLKVHFWLKHYCSRFILTSAFICQQSSFLFQDNSTPHVSVITGNILITMIRFSRYHLLLASNSTFMTDSMYLGTIQICQNLNEHYCYSISTISVINE